MMTTYLKNYVGSVSELPGELARKFKLMRELDEKAQALQAEAEAAARQRLEELAQKAEHASAAPTPKRSRTAQASAQSDAAAATATDQQIEAQMRQVLHYSEEKIGLSQQIYDYVDQKIRRLDKDLKNFEGDIARERTKLGLGEGERASSLLPQEDNPADKGKGLRQQKKGKAGAGRGSGAKSKKLSLLGPTALTRGPGLVPLDIAEAKKGAVRDPAEPVYCYCQRVSFGEMVACDNADCLIEWFHYECVGLEEPPKGKWYCKDCEELRKSGQLMED